MQKRTIRSDNKTVRERATFSYDPSTTTPDIKEQILKLGEMENCPYWGRSFAAIAGMILQKALPKEIQKYEKGDSR